MRRDSAHIKTVEANFPELGELRSASTADGGTSLSTSRARVYFPSGTRVVSLKAHTSASSATVAKISMIPYLSVFKTQDDGVTYIDYSTEANDNSTSTDIVMSSQGTAAQGDYLYVGAHRPFRGLNVDIDGANANAATAAVTYWNGGAWVDITPTDGTESGGATLAQDAEITWTVPTGWKRTRINGRELYWVRIAVSAALDSSVTINGLIPLPATTRAELFIGDAPVWFSVYNDYLGFVGIEAITDTGTCKLIVNVATGPYETF